VAVVDRIEQICRREFDARALRIALLREIRTRMRLDSYVWLLTDPETCVGCSPLAETPSLADLPTLIRLKYLTPTNRWTSLPSDASVTLVEATGGDRSKSRVWNELLSGYGVDDVASAVFRDRYGCWGFLDLWRSGRSFTSSERDLLSELCRVVTPALRRSLAATFSRGSSGPDHHGGPIVLMLSDDLELLTQTPSTDAYLRALLPTDADRAPVPAGAYNVAAQLLAQETGVDAHPPWARVHLRDGLWVTLRAARLVGTSSDGAASIAVSIEPTPPAERTALYARVFGLTERERELLQHLVGGCNTRELARRMYLSEHTVQDHLKSVFAKTGANSRRTLIARATGAG
jgi:DNA-binding CsgD family transcriptional regulator